MNYRKNYFKIYFWQSISVLLGFAALFVVVPFISSNKIIYGIYSVCTSLTIFFSYADLGFLSSGVKYAAECYVRGEKEKEIRIVGFTSFIMVSIFSVLAFGLVLLGFFPKILIPELLDGSELYRIAQWLLFTLAVSCPIIIGQRLLNLVFTIRVEDYKFQRMNIVGNLIRILSVLFFFGGGRYMIIEYYVFYQLVNLIVVLFAIYYIRMQYGYGLCDLMKAFRFDKEVFDKVKGLTGASLIIMISSVIYYELDQVVISNVIGIEAVAVYAVALSVLQLVRTFCAIVYSPYISRFNHFVGLNDIAGLGHFVKKMIILFAPILIVPIFTLSLMAEPFVISWVGEQYRESSVLVSLLVLCFIYNFVKEPIGQYFVATERNRVLVRYNLLTPIVFWLGVLMLIYGLETKAFAIMKFVAPVFSLVAYWLIITQDFRSRGLRFLKLTELLKTIVPTMLIVYAFTWLFGHWMIEEQSRNALLQNIILMATTVILSLAFSIPFNSEIKIEVTRIWTATKNKLIG